MIIVRLIRDSYPFAKGTEFIVTGGDDGFWSKYAFYTGQIIYEGKKLRISVEDSACEFIEPKDYKGTVIMQEDYLKPRKPMTDSEFWEEWLNSPG